MKNLKKHDGITLVALVITIIVIVILATVTINMAFGDNGLIRRAEQAKDFYANDTEYTAESIEEITSYIDSITAVELETVTDTNHENLKATDIYGNVITVPSGFKIVMSEATTVPEGIVIEDEDGNQFVWIPVGTVYKNEDRTISSRIQLGRYTFDSEDGTPNLVQAAYTGSNPNNYEKDVRIYNDMGFEFIEVDDAREGHFNISDKFDSLNATSKDLAGFVQSVKDNGGYYIARYEASFGSGNSRDNRKPLSKISTANSETEINYVEGTLWNFVTQLDAAKACRNMYDENNQIGAESDLMNSYAWDTAVVFIQEMDEANSNYANKIDGSGTLRNTGETEDKVCNIFNMASNLREFTTEYSNGVNATAKYPCTGVGGYYKSTEPWNTTTERASRLSVDYRSDYGFRPILYIK